MIHPPPNRVTSPPTDKCLVLTFKGFCYNAFRLDLLERLSTHIVVANVLLWPFATMVGKGKWTRG